MLHVTPLKTLLLTNYKLKSNRKYTCFWIITRVECNHSSNISSEWTNTSSQWDQSYLDQGAVAISRCLCVKVIMVEDGGEAGDHRLQGSAVLLNLPHTRDQALGNSAVWQIRGTSQNSNVVFTYFLQGCKYNLVFHIWGWEKKRDEIIIP